MMMLAEKMSLLNVLGTNSMAPLSKVFSGAVELAPCALALGGLLLSFFAQLAGHAAEEKWQAPPYILHGFVDAPLLEWLCTWHSIRALAGTGVKNAEDENVTAGHHNEASSSVPEVVVHVFRSSWNVRREALIRCAQILARRERNVQTGCLGPTDVIMHGETPALRPPPSPSFALGMRPSAGSPVSPILLDDNGYGTSVPTLKLPATSGNESSTRTEHSPLLETSLGSGNVRRVERNAEQVENDPKKEDQGPRATASSLLVSLGLGPVLGLPSHASRKWRARTGSGTSDDNGVLDSEPALLAVGTWGISDALSLEQRQKQLKQMQRIVHEQKEQRQQTAKSPRNCFQNS